MSELLISLSDLLVAAWSLLRAVSALLLPWFPLAVWIGFWLCVVNWIKLREVLVSEKALQGRWHFAFRLCRPLHRSAIEAG